MLDEDAVCFAVDVLVAGLVEVRYEVVALVLVEDALAVLREEGFEDALGNGDRELFGVVEDLDGLGANLVDRRVVGDDAVEEAVLEVVSGRHGSIIA